MKRTTHILYALAWVVYLAFSWGLFPVWNINVVIPALVLFGITTWVYGKSIALKVILPGLVYHYLLVSYYADIHDCYQAMATGTIVCILVIMVTGTLKSQINAIRETHSRLDRMVAERNAELDRLTRQLLEQSEHKRVLMGQELHDGIGQQLTGIQLFSSVLAEQLEMEQDSSASMTRSLNNHALTAHNLIRRTARTLFPVRMKESGLLPALEELAACFNSLYSVDFTVAACGNLQALPHETALQLYRICQESALAIARQSNSGARIAALANAEDDQCTISLSHDTPPLGERMNDSPELRLIHYRLRQVNGSFTARLDHTASETLSFSAPMRIGQPA